MKLHVEHIAWQSIYLVEWTIRICVKVPCGISRWGTWFVSVKAVNHETSVGEKFYESKVDNWIFENKSKALKIFVNQGLWNRKLENGHHFFI